MTNIGHSPAQDVTTWAQLIPKFGATRSEVESYYYCVINVELHKRDNCGAAEEEPGR
jgi:hypothetical protein